MAKEKEDTPEKQDKGTKKVNKLKILIFLFIGILLGGGGIGVGFVVGGKKLPGGKEKTEKVATENSESKGEEASGEKVKNGEKNQEGKIAEGTVYTLDPPFMINLAEVNGRRFLKVSIDLEIDKAITKEEMGAKKSPIRDSIILLLSEKSFADINTVTGKEKLKSEIMKRCNGFLKPGSVLNVYFTEFLVQ